ncbi:MAG TPA: SDR family NAD(P)-dependent oxidoreductase, partial [Burkholderiaceae bacterium]|nr:SDR family NAD(P)-dependent oxidoreductase [Burkholderiaceae bacterium]
MGEEKSLNLLIVTGGSRGLGKSLVELYQSEEWSILEFSRGGIGLHHMPVDLGDLDASFAVLEAQLQTLAKTPWERVVFINNAGLLTPIAPVRTLTDAQIEHNLTINLVSGIRLISSFVRAFAESDSQITIANVSSGAALKGYSGWSLYCAAKAGMENYIRALAAEQSTAAKRMTCVNIDPGKMDTDMQGEIRNTATENFPDVAHFIEAKNTGQLRSAKSVARAIMTILD